MAICICVGTLAAFGILCAFWAAFGWLLSGGSGTVVCLGEPVERMLLARRLLWLRSIGLFRISLVVPDTGLKEWEIRELDRKGTEIIAPSELARRLQIGAEESGAAGVGDPTGDRGRSGLSEL